MKTNFYFRNLFLIVAVISSLLLTACGGGGGGGGSNPPATSNVTISIDGSDLNINSSSRAQADDNDSLILKTTAYLKGSLKNDIKVEDRKATKSGSNYVCNIQGLLNGYDYRFSAYYNGKKLMENQLAASELQNNAEIPVNIDTSIKTLAYDSWKSKSPSNASVENFKQNCENIGLTEDKDFQQLYDLDAYKQSLAKIVKGDEASLPTKNDIDTTPISATDVETTNKPVSGTEQALVGKWYLNYGDNYHVEPDSNGNVNSLEFDKNHTFKYTSYYYDYESESRRANVSRAGLRLTENPQYKQIATGTWILETDKLILTFTDGNKQHDSKYVFRNIVITKNTLSWSINSIVEIYKKTKWSFENKIPEPASATQALIGDWTLTTRNGVKVSPNSEGYLPKYNIKSDHTYSAKKIYMEDGKFYDWSEDEVGKWYFELGVIYFKPNTNTGYEYELAYKVDIDKNSIKIHDSEYNSKSDVYIDVIYTYSKNQSGSSSSTTTNSDLVGIWYLNYEDGKPMVPNSQGEVETLTLKSDGTCTWKEFDTTDYGHSSYWEPEGTAYTATGRWSYSNGKLTTTIEGYTMSFPVTLKDGALTLTGTYEGSTETYTSVYKKTKYSK